MSIMVRARKGDEDAEASGGEKGAGGGGGKDGVYKLSDEALVDQVVSCCVVFVVCEWEG